MMHEGRARIERAQRAMAGGGFDGLLLLNSSNLLYLSGYPAVERTLARPHYLVVPRRGAPVFLVHEGREAEARRYGWIEDVRTYRDLSVAPIGKLAQIAADRGVREGRFGCELGFDQRIGIPFGEFDRIRAELAPARFEDAADLLWRLRMIKSSADLAALREACRITADALEQTILAAGAGTTDRAAAIAVQGHMTGKGATDPWVAIAAGRGNYDLATGVGSGQVLEPGDMVWMDAGCTIRGYRSDFGRAGVIGGPSTEQLNAQRQIWQITAEGVRMTRPGVPVRDIAAHVNQRVEALGLPLTSNISGLAGRIGHGLGLDITEPPHVSEQDSTILEVGMVITIEPGVATDFGIFHIEQDVVVTLDGPEVVSLAPWQLRTIPA